jgi:hypothetical protein
MDREGNSFERTAIQEWISRDGTSPVTRSVLRPTDLVPNRALKDAIATSLAQVATPLLMSATDPADFLQARRAYRSVKELAAGAVEPDDDDAAGPVFRPVQVDHTLRRPDTSSSEHPRNDSLEPVTAPSERLEAPAIAAPNTPMLPSSDVAPPALAPVPHGEAIDLLSAERIVELLDMDSQEKKIAATEDGWVRVAS